MTCEEVAEFLLDYLEHQVTDEQRRIFEHHLSVCPDCRNYIDSYRKTIQLAKAAEVQAANSIEIPEGLVQAILRARRA
jgi:predicted anti-sigma-YlaC factor YlaD